MSFNIDIEEHDYYELLKLSEVEWIESWLIELGFDLENPDDYAFYINNTNKIILKAMNLGLLRNIFTAMSIMPAWGTGNSSTMGTHTYIYNTAINILKQDGEMGAYNYINAYSSNLRTYVNEPDILDSENTTGTHYYIVKGKTSVIGAYYKSRNDNYSRSARSKLEDHYNTAVYSFKNDNKAGAMRSLGYAIHFLSDAICPPHAAGISDADHSNKPHKAYEDYVDNNNSLYAATSATGYYGIWNKNFEGLNTYCELSARFSSYILAKTNYPAITEATLPLTQQLVAALMLQFYNDTVVATATNSERHEKAIENNKIYFIKNLKSGMYLDVKGWGTASDTVVQQFSFSGDTNQQFRAIYDSAGHFRFEPVHCTGTVKTLSFTDSGNAIIKNVTNSIYQRFKPVYLKDGYYRIMTGYPADNDFADVLRVKSDYYSLRNGIDKYNYDPDSLNHYWSFEEIIDVDATFNTSELKASKTYTDGLKVNKIYMIRPSVAATYKFTKSNVYTAYEYGYRSGTGNSTFTRVGFGNMPSILSCSLSSNRTYYFKFMPDTNATNLNSFSTTTLSTGQYRYVPTSTANYTITSVGNNISITNSAGALLSKTATAETIKLVANETYYIDCQK